MDNLWSMIIEGSLTCHNCCARDIRLKGRLRGTVTLTSNGRRLAVELSLPVLRLRSVAAGIRTSNLPHANALTDCVTAATVDNLENASKVSNTGNLCTLCKINKKSKSNRVME